MSNYNILIDKLVSKLTLKQYSNYIINLVNKRDYVKIIELTDDLDMFDILADIEKERQRIADNLEKNLVNHKWLNKMLIKFGEKPQSSYKKALNELKTKVYINIYDLEGELYNKKTTFKKLNQDLKDNPSRRFPKIYAKNNPTLKCFLIKTEINKIQ